VRRLTNHAYALVQNEEEAKEKERNREATKKR
jgi:hypothetical protein